MKTDPPLLIAAQKLGGQAALARALNVSSGLVWQWLNDRRPLPAEHCPPIEVATAIRCEELRPDVAWARDEKGQITGYHVPLSAHLIDQAA